MSELSDDQEYQSPPLWVVHLFFMLAGMVWGWLITIAIQMGTS